MGEDLRLECYPGWPVSGEGAPLAVGKVKTNAPLQPLLRKRLWSWGVECMLVCVLGGAGAAERFPGFI